VSLDLATGGDAPGTTGLTVLPVIAAVMIVVGLLAAAGPARRELRIHPAEALRDRKSPDHQITRSPDHQIRL
jgi:ABC-type antimicrobial peptide transport system permease subunit